MDENGELSILYVEDDQDTREELSLFLQQKCKHIHIAEDGKVGLEIYKDVNPDLIISDIQMPNMNGVDMALEIRKLNEYVPIIFLSAFNEVSYLKQSISIGVIDYVTKPVDLKHLSTKIDEVLHPEKIYIFKLRFDKKMNIVDIHGNISKVFKNEDELLCKPLEEFIIENQRDKYQRIIKHLEDNNFFYREQFSIKNSKGEITEFLVDGHKLDNGIIEFELTLMRYFVYSYKKIENVLAKERALNQILEYKNAIFELMVVTKDSNDFLHTICEHIVHYKKYSLAMFYELDNSKKGFELSAFASSAHITENDLVCKFLIQDNKSRTAKALEEKKPLLLENEELSGCPFFEGLEFKKKPKNLILIPLFLYEKSPVIGIFVVAGEEEFLFNIYELGMLGDIGRIIALGIERIEDKQRLKELLDKANQQSRTDALTGSYNRLMFDEMLEKNILQSERYDTPLSLLYMDLDHFKSVNDKFGHKEGDKVLISFVRMVSQIIRGSDLFARIGGEEFGLILPRANLQNAIEVGEKIKYQLQNKPLLSNGEILTTSIGVATYDLEQKRGSDHLLEQADAKLYEAKHTGRNKICY